MPSIYCDNTVYAPWNQLDRESNEDVGDEVADPGLPHLHDDVVDVSLLHVLVNVRQGPVHQNGGQSAIVSGVQVYQGIE